MKNAEETPGGWIWRGSLPVYRRFLMKNPQISLGRWGEWLALIHLRRLRWDIVTRNWRTREGEVDLIAYDGPYLVFTEVKTRRLKPKENRSAQQTSTPGKEGKSNNWPFFSAAGTR